MMSKWFQSCGCLAVTVMLSAIAAACDNSGLSESEARRVIDEEVLPKSRKWLQVEIDLYSTPLWRNGEAAGLTVRENCWISDRQPLHAKEWWYVTQEDGEISPECPDIASAELFVSEQDRKWYEKN